MIAALSRAIGQRAGGVFGLAVAFLSIGGLCAAIIVFSSDAREQMRRLGVADAGLSGWTMAQAEIEFARHVSALHWTGVARGEAVPDLSAVRRTFDIFYSRFDTITRSSGFAELRRQEGIAELLGRVDRYLDRAVILIDGDDRTLAANLEALHMEADAIEPVLRQLSQAGLEVAVEQRRLNRLAAGQALTRLAYLVVILVALLSLAVLVLAVLFGSIRQLAGIRGVKARRLEAIMENAGEAIVVIDGLGRVVEFNPEAERIFGWTRQEIMGRKMSDRLMPLHFRANHDAGLTRIRGTGERRLVGAGHHTLEGLRKTGEVFPLEMSISSAVLEGEVIYIGFLADISRRVAEATRQQEVLDRALETAERRGALVRTLGPGILRVLDVARASLDSLRDTGLSGSQMGQLQKGQAGIDLLLDHLTDLADLVEHGDGGVIAMPREVNLHDLLAEVAEDLRLTGQGGRCRIVLPSPEGEGAVLMGDAQRILRILRPMLATAMALSSGGEVRLSIICLGDRSGTEVRLTCQASWRSLPDLSNLLSDPVLNSPSAEMPLLRGLLLPRMIARSQRGDMGVEGGDGDEILLWLRLPSGAVDEAAPEERRLARRSA